MRSDRKDKKVRLGVIFFSDKERQRLNLEQYNFLKKNLFDFTLKKYDFNKKGQLKLLRDFRNQKIDIVLKNSYGRGNECIIESFLELAKIPYLGSDSRTTFIATSKFLSKSLFRLHGLPVPKDIFIDWTLWAGKKRELLRDIQKLLGFPCVIKDTGGTDSRGIVLVRKRKELPKTLEKFLKNGKQVIIEEYLKNTHELTCFTVGNQNPRAYRPVEIKVKNKNGIFSAKVKDKIRIKLAPPSNIERKIVERVKRLAILAHKTLNCQTFSRSDFLVKKDKIYLLEIDVHPGFRGKSPTTQSAKWAGLTINDLFRIFYTLAKETRR